ncbi:MAG: type III toxin-antitoxin system ToxN/AbiQ family toxin [Lachnospiraceae bacterium]|nr:type III toxin-antitoxin system ToxN/AbiQ family toxin [Lachnospiraceae bacterium]
MKKLDLYYIDLKYIRDLSRVDDNVMSISPQRGKQNRPFVGVVVLINGRNYCVPLTSPKDKFKNKRSQVDFIKIFDENRRDANGQYKLIGVLNINNMIPVNGYFIKKVDIAVKGDDKPDIVAKKRLMQKQIKWCRKHVDTIENRANKVYDMVINHPDKNQNLVKRSSKFYELEKMLDKIMKKD